MVNSRNENGQEVGQKGWLFLEVECQSLIITIAGVSSCISGIVKCIHLDVGSSYNHILELVMFPSIGRALYHCQSGVVLEALFRHKKFYVKYGNAHEFVIFNIQEHQFWPKVCSLSSFDDLNGLHWKHQC